MSKKLGERILGPYEQADGWRVIEIDVAGKRSSVMFETEGRATRYADMMRAELAREDHTTGTAIKEYAKHLADDGNKPQSVEVIVWAIELMFPEPIVLKLLSAKRCEKLYDELRSRPMKTGLPPSVDTHRNALAQARRFLSFCVRRGWLAENPCAELKGKGKRRPRGKSLGKAGNELRTKSARAWYAKALELAGNGDRGAIAGLVAMLLGMRASEIVSRRVADLEDQDQLADSLWIPCTKSPAGRRTLEVPEVLRPLLLTCAEGKAPDRYLLEQGRPGHEHKPHRRSWVISQVHRICDAAKVPRVTAHAMRGLLATIAAERGLAGHLIAAHMGHENENTTMRSYAAPGSAAAGARLRGWAVLDGGSKPA